MNNRHLWGIAALVLAGLLLRLPEGAVLAADCATDADGNITCVNSVDWTASVLAQLPYPDAGDASVTNTASGTVTVTGNDVGLVASANSGNATAVNDGTVTSEGPGMFAGSGTGEATATNSGTVTTSGQWAYAVQATGNRGTSSATNSGTLTTTGDYGYGLVSRNDYGTAAATNTGTITTSGDSAFGIKGSSDTGTVTLSNSGTVMTTGSGAHGLVAYGSDSGEDYLMVSNSGTVTTAGANAVGLYASTEDGTASVTNSGTVTTTANGGYVWPGAVGLRASSLSGWASVTNSGTVTTSAYYSPGLFAQGGRAATIFNSGTILTTGNDSPGLYAESWTGTTSVSNSGSITTTGMESAGIETGESDDTVINSGDITVTGYDSVAIDTGRGDDTVIIEGGALSGLIDGGQDIHNDHDRLVFAAVLDVASYDVTVADLRRQLASADPAGGTITFRGEAYTYANFEELLNWLTLAMFHDGRVNQFDFAATATAYCAGGGAQLYRIHADGQGEWAYNVTDGAVQAALAQAQATGQHVLIADRLGVQLWALADRSAEGVQQLQLMGPDGYVSILPANTCGFTD